MIQRKLQNTDPNEGALYAAIADIETRSGRGIHCLESLNQGGTDLQDQIIKDIQKLLEVAQENLHLEDPKFGPTFKTGSIWIGGADADLIDQRCLIDIKAGEKIEPASFLRQTIAYALLDIEDEHQLESVGIYLARQGITWNVKLDDIAKENGTTLQKMRTNAPWNNPNDKTFPGSEGKQISLL